MKGPTGCRQRDVGSQDERLGHGARLSFSQPHGQRALARSEVFLSVADIVDGYHDGAQEAALNACYDAGIVHRKRFHQRAGHDGCRAYLYQNGSQYGNQSEEEDDEYFPQALVGQRPRPSRISIGEVEGRDADGEDGPAAQFDKGKGQQARSQQEEEANEHDCSVGEGSAGRHAHGSGPLFCIGVLGMVNGVIEKIAGNLEAQAGSQRQEGQGRIPAAGQFLHHHAACPYWNQGGGERLGACRQKGGSNDIHVREGSVISGEWGRGGGGFP